MDANFATLGDQNVLIGTIHFSLVNSGIVLIDVQSLAIEIADLHHFYFAKAIFSRSSFQFQNQIMQESLDDIETNRAEALAREAAIRELRSICTETRNNIMTLLGNNTAERSGFFERRVEWCHGKTDQECVTIICDTLTRSQDLNLDKDSNAVHELAQHCYDWFEGHSTFIKNDEFNRFASTAYSLENFVSFLRTLTYDQLSRWLEEAITDECDQELILSLMQ